MHLSSYLTSVHACIAHSVVGGGGGWGHAPLGKLLLRLSETATSTQNIIMATGG